MYRSTYKGDYIFEPDDNKINILRGYDFIKIGELECNVCMRISKLHNTTSGILIINPDGIHLLNKN